MAVDRPTFSESWYRVVHLHPRLRTVAQTFRQHYRGRMWHVVRDPANNQFFRLNEAAYHFLGLLDGERNVGEAWDICQEQLGDEAPTQGETIELLGQLYTANLLSVDQAGDYEGLFTRYTKRRRKEIGGYLMNLLFIRIPLLDPDNILNVWVGVVGWIFTWIGLIVWAGILAVGGYFLIAKGDMEALVKGADPQLLLDSDNLILLYTAFAIIKAIHEFGHGFACKYYGKDSPTRGEVHTMGIMLLVFMPVPFVDASTAWSFRSKWQRIIVAAAGMYVELAVASIAAIIWVHTSPDHVLNQLAYNAMFIASVSTLLFNANPLLRFDGYYMLSDALEIPNLAQRSKQYLYYLVRKYVYGVERAKTTAHTPGERPWLLLYAVASSIYRVFISVSILLYVADKLFIVGALLAMSGLVGWVFVPLGKWIKYLATSQELFRTRTRAVMSTFLFLGLIIGCIGLIPVPEHQRSIGVVEPARLVNVYMPASGRINEVMPSGMTVTPGGPPLLVASSRELDAELLELDAQLEVATVQRRQAQNIEAAAVEAIDKQIESLTGRINETKRDLKNLTVQSPATGTWISPEIDRAKGMFLDRGAEVGMVASVDELIIRVTADQYLGPRIEPELGLGAEVEVRVAKRPDIQITGVVEKIYPVGSEKLPSQALGYHAGGSMLISTDDPSGQTAQEAFFEIKILPTKIPAHLPQLMSGQRVVARFRMESKPLAQQWYRSIRQLIQRRFQI